MDTDTAFRIADQRFAQLKFEQAKKRRPAVTPEEFKLVFTDGRVQRLDANGNDQAEALARQILQNGSTEQGMKLGKLFKLKGVAFLSHGDGQIVFPLPKHKKKGP